MRHGAEPIYETALSLFCHGSGSSILTQRIRILLRKSSITSGTAARGLSWILSADNGSTFDEVNEYADGELDPSAAQEICTAGDCTTFSMKQASRPLEDTDAVFLEEFKTLRSLTGELLDGTEFGTPVDPMDSMSIRRIQFETTDTDGQSREQ